MDSRFCSSRNLPGIIDGVSPHVFLSFVVVGGIPQNCAQGPHSTNPENRTRKQQQKHMCLSGCGDRTSVSDHFILPEDPEMAGRSHNSDETG